MLISGLPKRGHYERQFFTEGISRISRNSRESLENGRILLYFPESGGSPNSPESLDSIESRENELFCKTPSPKDPFFRFLDYRLPDAHGVDSTDLRGLRSRTLSRTGNTQHIAFSPALGLLAPGSHKSCSGLSHEYSEDAHTTPNPNLGPDKLFPRICLPKFSKFVWTFWVACRLKPFTFMNERPESFRKFSGRLRITFWSPTPALWTFGQGADQVDHDPTFSCTFSWELSTCPWARSCESSWGLYDLFDTETCSSRGHFRGQFVNTLVSIETSTEKEEFASPISLWHALSLPTHFSPRRTWVLTLQVPRSFILNTQRTQWDICLPRGKNCRGTIFSPVLPLSYPHHEGIVLL